MNCGRSGMGPSADVVTPDRDPFQVKVKFVARNPTIVLDGAQSNRRLRKGVRLLTTKLSGGDLSRSALGRDSPISNPIF